MECLIGQKKKSTKQNKTTTNTDFLEKEYILKGLRKKAYSVNASWEYMRKWNLDLQHHIKSWAWLLPNYNPSTGKAEEDP